MAGLQLDSGGGKGAGCELSPRDRANPLVRLRKRAIRFDYAGLHAFPPSRDWLSNLQSTSYRPARFRPSNASLSATMTYGKGQKRASPADGREARVDIGADRFGAALGAIARILDAAEGHFRQGEA